MQLKYSFFKIVLFCITPVLLSAQDSATSPLPYRRGNLPWRYLPPIEEKPSLQQTFNALLSDLSLVTTIGFKATPLNLGANAENQEPFFMVQGDLINVSETWHLAIKGKGFFRVETPNGEILYTRNGEFSTDEQGFLRNKDGYLLSPPLQLGSDVANIASISIDSEIIIPIELSSLYVFKLFLPTDDDVVRNGIYFEMANVDRVVTNAQNRVLQQQLELSTTQASEALLEMSNLLFQLQHENPEENFEFQQYLISHLLRVYTDAEGDVVAIQRFLRLMDNMTPRLTFEIPSSI